MTVILVDRCNRPIDAGFYLMKAICGVCGEAHVVQLSKGQRPFDPQALCPHCELDGTLSYCHSSTALDMLSTHQARLYLQTPDGIGPAAFSSGLPEVASLDDVLAGMRGEV